MWPQRDGQCAKKCKRPQVPTSSKHRKEVRVSKGAKKRAPVKSKGKHLCQSGKMSFALVSQICVRREALHLFGSKENELLPDLHITRDGVLRIGLGAHQEHRVNHVTRARDRTIVSADVFQLPMMWILRLNRLCRKVMPVTPESVKVRSSRCRSS